MIQTRHLFTLTADVPRITDLGATPAGSRRIATVTGGVFKGERLSGTIHAAPGGDWILVRPDGATVLDVRITLETDDGAIIYMTYTGVVARNDAGLYWRVRPVFYTASEKYGWLNHIVAVGKNKQVQGKVAYDIFRIL